MNIERRPEAPRPAAADDARWAAVLERAADADDDFVYAVVTTGVFCRPGCAARRPRRENVRFFATPAAARAAGFRACRRCDPERNAGERDAALLREACRRIDEALEPPRRSALASALGISESRLARLFRSHLGITPSEYLRSRRAARVRAGLEAGASVTQALHTAGYGSPSRFYEDADAALLGMPPSRYRAGAPGEHIEWMTAACSLGRVLVASTARGICAIELGDDDAELLSRLARRFARATLQPAATPDQQTLAAVVALMEQPSSGADLPLDIRGTAFQRRVWAALRDIPAGQRISYGALAERLGAQRGARAVASAVAANPLAVVVPCHRVVGADGRLRGYRWGVERKRELLARETPSPARRSD